MQPWTNACKHSNKEAVSPNSYSSWRKKSMENYVGCIQWFYKKTNSNSFFVVWSCEIRSFHENRWFSTSVLRFVVFVDFFPSRRLPTGFWDLLNRLPFIIFTWNPKVNIITRIFHFLFLIFLQDEFDICSILEKKTIKSRLKQWFLAPSVFKIILLIHGVWCWICKHQFPSFAGHAVAFH